MTVLTIVVVVLVTPFALYAAYATLHGLAELTADFLRDLRR